MSKELEDKLRSMKVGDLKKEISKTNVRGYSKLKKEDVIKFMLANKKRFMYLINKEKQFITKGGKTFPVGKKEEPKKEEPKKELTKEERREQYLDETSQKNTELTIKNQIKPFLQNPTKDKLSTIQKGAKVSKTFKTDLAKRVSYIDDFMGRFKKTDKKLYDEFIKVAKQVIQKAKDDKKAKEEKKKKPKKEEPKKEEPKKEEPKKEEPKPQEVKKELSKIDKLKEDLKKFQNELDQLAQPRSAKTAEIAEKLIDMRTKLSSKIANIKFNIFEEEGKQKDRDEKERIKKEKKELADFKKAVNDFIKKPTEELLEEIDNKFELTDDIPESLLKKLEKAIDKFNKPEEEPKKTRKERKDKGGKHGKQTLKEKNISKLISLLKKLEKEDNRENYKKVIKFILTDYDSEDDEFNELPNGNINLINEIPNNLRLVFQKAEKKYKS